MSQRLLNSLDRLFQRTPILNHIYNDYRNFLIKNAVIKSLNKFPKKHTYFSSSGESLTHLSLSRIALIEKAVALKKHQCILNDSTNINLYPIYLYIFEDDKVLAEMFKTVIEDEYENDSNAISAYNIIYRDSKAFRDLETEAFDEMLRSAELLHNNE